GVAADDRVHHQTARRGRFLALATPEHDIPGLRVNVGDHPDGLVLVGVASCAARLDGRLLRWEVVAPQPRPRELPHALRVTGSTESGAAVVDQLLVAHLGRPEELPIALFRLAPVEAHAARQQLVPRGEQALCEGVLGSHRLAVVRRLPLLLARSTQRTTLLGLRLTTADRKSKR